MMHSSAAPRGDVSARRANSPLAPRRSSLSMLPDRDVSDEPLIRRLALDRLRELHDDGVTLDYIGRMYGVSGDHMREVESELRGRR